MLHRLHSLAIKHEPTTNLLYSCRSSSMVWMGCYIPWIAIMESDIYPSYDKRLPNFEFNCGRKGKIKQEKMINTISDLIKKGQKWKKNKGMRKFF